jgi:hypothetical protein
MNIKNVIGLYFIENNDGDAIKMNGEHYHIILQFYAK